LIITGTPSSLVWVGDGALNTWDFFSLNWTNPATASLDNFNELDHVTFNNFGGANSNVDLTVSLRPASVTVDGAANYSFVGAGQLSGAMALTKAGSGTLTVSNANNFTGLTTISGGILRLANNAALGTSAGGTIIQSGGTLDVHGYQTSADHIQVAGSGAGGIGAIINTLAEQQNAIRLLTLTADTHVSSDFRWDVRGAGGSGSLSGIFDLGGFTFTRTGTNRIAIVDSIATNAGNIVMVEGGMSLTRSIIDGPGYINVGTNFVWIENSTTGRIAKPMIFAGGRLQCSGGDFWLDSFITNLSGLTIDAANNLTINNQISGAGALTKIAGGAVVLEAANTYAGDTIIEAGTLRLGTNGTIGGGSAITMNAGATFDVLAKGGFTVASGKTMTGAGTVNGALTVANGGILHVGIPNGTGTLTVNNGNVTLSGSTLMKLNPATKTSDAITTTNSIALGGTLTVSLLSGSPATGDTYKLFNAPVISGSFSSYNLPPLGPSQLWVNRLSTDGTLVVSELVLTANMIPGGFLQFTWPTQLNGLVKLQAQTNSLSTGLSSNWADYPGGTFNGTVIVPDPSLPTVFFRLISIP
jgi:fibronectin-binding autotransporter adhesin